MKSHPKLGKTQFVFVFLATRIVSWFDTRQLKLPVSKSSGFTFHQIENISGTLSSPETTE